MDAATGQEVQLPLRDAVAYDRQRALDRPLVPAPPFDLIAASGGRVAVEDVVQETGFTRRHLGNLFQSQVGLSPKSLARIHRFRGALDLLNRADGEVPWAALAERCGFYDQSHLINEFRRFTGLSPTELTRRARPDAGSIVLR